MQFVREGTWTEPGIGYPRRAATFEEVFGSSKNIMLYSMAECVLVGNM